MAGYGGHRFEAQGWVVLSTPIVRLHADTPIELGFHAAGEFGSCLSKNPIFC